MTSTSNRYAYLDGIRALAIGSVIALHWLLWYVPFFRGGGIGVDVFFTLSGFIITTMLWRSPATGGLGRAYASFVKRRVVRLYPALLGLVVGAVVLFAVVPSAEPGPVEVAKRGLLVLTQSTSLVAATHETSFLVPGLAPFGPTWSLAVEWYFYLLWPLLLLALRHRGWAAGRTARLTAGLAVAAYVLSLPLGDFWFYFGPTARFGEILAGAALALALQARGTERPAPRVPAFLPGLLLGVFALYVVLAPEDSQPVFRLLGVPIAVATCLVLILDGYGDRRGAVHRLLSHPWLAYVGRLSYSLYLWHVVPFLALSKVTAFPKPVVGLMFLGLTAALTLASYRWLEKPFLKARSDVLMPRRAAAAPVAEPAR